MSPAEGPPAILTGVLTSPIEPSRYSLDGNCRSQSPLHPERVQASRCDCTATLTRTRSALLQRCYEDTLDVGEKQHWSPCRIHGGGSIAAKDADLSVIIGWSLRQGRSLKHASWSSFARAHPSIKIFLGRKGAFAGDFCTLAAFMAI